jgi:hypothetical protein
MKKVKLALLSALMLVYMATIAISPGEPIVQATIVVYPPVIAPGNDGYIQLIFKNMGTAIATRIKITSVTTDAPINYKGWVAELGSLNPGDSSTTILKFSVLEDAPPGLYSITFTIDYCQDSICKTIYPIGIVNIQSLPAIEVTSVRPKTLKLGEMTNMSFTILNRGNTITNVVFTWVSPDGALLPIGASNRVIIPSIKANSYYEVRSEVVVSSSITPGIHPINMHIQYIDKSGVNQTVTSVAGIEISAETDFDIIFQDYTAGVLSLVVANIGSTPAYSTVVRIPQQNNFKVVGTSSTLIGNLNVGDYTQVNFNLMPSKTDVTNKLLVEISYTDILGSRRTIQKEILITSINTTGINIWKKEAVTTSTIFTQSMMYIIVGVIGITGIIVGLKLTKVKKKK